MIYSKLYDWQKQIVDKFKDRDNFGLFLDMGLGKTPISLGFAEANKSTKILVISINSKAIELANIKGSWFNWACHMEKDYELISKTDKIEDINENNQMLLINYESIHKQFINRKGDKERKLSPLIEEFINSCKNQNVTVILDESHRVKNLSSITTKMIIKIKKLLKLKAKKLNMYLLSGTPFTQGYIDLYSQLKLLGYDKTKSYFTDSFCIKGNIAGLYEWQQPIVAYKNIEQLYALIHRYALTLESDDVIKLPKQIFIYHKSSISKTFKFITNEKLPWNDIKQELNNRKYNYLDDEFIIEKSKGEVLANNPFYRNLAFPETTWLGETTGTFWLRCRQASIGFQGNSENHQWFDKTRLDDIQQFLKDYRDNYIIFYNYTPELYELYDICEKLGYKIDVYSGEVKSLYFYEQYEKMSNEEKFSSNRRVILANFASGSTGMNWQLYNQCIMSSVPLYKDFAQGIKRQHRIGQDKTVFYHMFYQQNWLDYSMLNSLKETTDYNTKMFEADVKKEFLEFDIE